jgi:trigger factor
MRRLAKAGCVILLAAALLTGCGNSRKADEATTQSKNGTENITVDYGKGLNKDGTLEGVNPEDYVTVCQYDGIEIKKDDISATDDEVQAQIDSLMANYKTTKEIKDRKVADGDVVNIDYTGKVDGKEFDGGSAKGYDLTIGSHTFIDNFEEQLIGHNPGETVEVKVTFPEDYQSKDLAGKEAVFTTVINFISEQEEAELTDEFVKENFSGDPYNFTSVKDMKEKIAEQLGKNKQTAYVSNYLMENSTFKEIPKELVDKRMDVIVDDAKAGMVAQGHTFEDLLNGYGFKDEQAFRDAYYENAEQNVKTDLIDDVIAKQQNLSVKEDDIKDLLGEDYSSYLDTYSENYINRIVLNSLAVDYVVEHANIK